MCSENSKALLLKEDHVCGMSAFYEYILHGTVPEEESLTMTSQRVSAVVEFALKAFIFKLKISEALASAETKALRRAKNKAKATKAEKANEANLRGKLSLRS
jgi:23S rRNA maturation mini-RNase III